MDLTAYEIYFLHYHVQVSILFLLFTFYRSCIKYKLIRQIMY